MDVPCVYSTVTKRQKILDLYFYILIVRCHFLEKDYWISDPILKIKVYKTTCARAKKQEPCPWTRDESDVTVLMSRPRLELRTSRPVQSSASIPVSGEDDECEGL